MKLQRAYQSHGRIIPIGTVYDKIKNRGIKAHNALTRLFVNLFGEGTVKVQVNNKTFYLNKASSFKFINPEKGTNSPEYKNFKNKKSRDIINEVQKKINQASAEGIAILTAQAEASSIEDTWNPQKLEEAIKLLTYERDKQHSYGDPNVKDHPVLGQFDIMDYQKIQDDFSNCYNENYFTNPQPAYIACSFDEPCYFQGGSLGGVADFKIGFFHQELERSGIDYHWYWMNDQRAALYIPLKNRDEAFKLLGQILQKPFIITFLKQLKDQPKVNLKYWGFNSFS